MNKIYGFEEVNHKYSPQMFKLFTEVFHCPPLCHCVAGKVFVTHGGLFSATTSPSTSCASRALPRAARRGADERDALERPAAAPRPRAVEAWRRPARPRRHAKFLENNLAVVQPARVKDEGYEVEANGKLITVFSAPNYCDQMAQACPLRLRRRVHGKQFEVVAHPPVARWRTPAAAWAACSPEIIRLVYGRGSSGYGCRAAACVTAASGGDRSIRSTFLPPTLRLVNLCCIAPFGGRRRSCAMGCCSSKPDIGSGSGSTRTRHRTQSSKSGVSGRRLAPAPKPSWKGDHVGLAGFGEIWPQQPWIKPAGAARRLLPAPTRTRAG